MRTPLPSLVAVTALAAVTASAHAAPEPLVGATEVARIAPDGAIADGAIADDGAGLLAYGWSDQATRAEVRVLDLATGKDVRTIDVSALGVRLERVWLLGTGDGQTVFVVARAEDEALRVGALYDASGAELRRFGPADGLAVIERRAGLAGGQLGKKAKKAKKPKPPKKGAKPAPSTARPGFESLVISYKVAPHKSGGDVHTVEAFQPVSGKRVGKARSLHLVDGYDAKLDFRLNHWADDWTAAVGVKGGEWVKKENQRSPDVEARYSLLDGKFTSTAAIRDLYEHAGRYGVLAQFPNHGTFVRVADDLAGLELWRGGAKLAVTLDQPFDQYDLKSVSWTRGSGELVIGLKVDPWNAGAVKRKRQDPEYLDLYRVDDAGKATRVARVLATKKKLVMGSAAGRLWLAERNLGFDGSKSLTLYTIP